MKKVAFVLGLLLIVSMAVNLAQWQLWKGVEVTVERNEKVEVRDSMVKDSVPEVKDSADVGVMKVSVRRERMKPLEAQKVPEVEISDSDTIISLPITQKVYGDSLYKAYVSGYDVRLDSIVVREREVVRTVTEMKVWKPPRRRWHVSVTAGPMYGVMSQKIDIGVCVGVSWDIW